MVTSPRVWTTVALVVCLIGTPLSGTLFASGADDSSTNIDPSSSSLDSTGATLPRNPTGSIATIHFGESPVTAPEAMSFARATHPLQVEFGDDALPARTPIRAAIAQAAQSPFAIAADEGNAFGQRRGPYGGRRGGRGGRGGGNEGAAAAILLGTVAAITGAAVLVYANRPECNVNLRADGCGYGTKVVGGAVLTAGMAGLIVGALTWR